MTASLDGMAARSLAVFPAGSNGEFNLPPGLAAVIVRGKGCEIWDARGKRYLDFSMGWGSVLPGHAREEVVEAVARQAPLGSNFAYINEPGLRLAEEIVRLSPACERVRFCASGTEATLYCQRLARAFTGRSKILKFEGAYHGANEAGIVSLFPDNPPPFPEPDPSNAGIPPSALRDLLVAPFNDLDTTERVATGRADDLAGVIVEPLQRCLPPREGFLQGLRDLTRRLGVPLIFDEVVTGFRLAYGGAQERYGVIPDLVAYGKALGGGYPIGAFGGRADIMALVEEHRMNREPYVWTASSLGGNPVSSAAALAALGIYSQTDTYPRLQALGESLRAGMGSALDRLGVPAQVIGEGPLAQVVFSDGPVFDYRSTRRGDGALGRKLMLNLFENGIFLNPMGTKLYLSLAHNENRCGEFLDRFEQGLRTMLD